MSPYNIHIVGQGQFGEGLVKNHKPLYSTAVGQNLNITLDQKLKMNPIQTEYQNTNGEWQMFTVTVASQKKEDHQRLYGCFVGRAFSLEIRINRHIKLHFTLKFKWDSAIVWFELWWWKWGENKVETQDAAYGQEKGETVGEEERRI